MQDMRAAGLNPILAYQQGAGSVPSGAMAEQGQLGEGLAAAGGSAMDWSQRRYAIKQLQAQTKVSDAQGRSAQAQADIDEAKRDVLLSSPTATMDIKVAGKSIAGESSKEQDSYLKQQIIQDLYATGSSARQAEATATAQKALAALHETDARRVNNLIQNENVSELTKLLVQTGGMLVGDAIEAARILISRGILLPVPGRGKVGF